ncbi:MAG: MFS transporter [Dehalococcoidia bacterium]
MMTLSPQERHAYEANIWKSYLFQFLTSFQLWWPVWVLYLTDFRGFSLTQVGGLEGLFWVVIVLGEVPTGAVADRFGRKISLILGAMCTIAAILVFGFATNYWIVLLSYVAWGLGLTFQSGADSAMVFESLKAVGRERDYQRVAGVSWGLFSLGMLAGLLVGAPLAQGTDLAFPVRLSAGIAFLTLLVSFTLKEPALPHGETRLSYSKLFGESMRTVRSQPAVRSMLVLAALIMAVANPIIVFSQPFLDAHDVSIGMLGVAQAPTRLAGILGAVTAYRISAAFGLRATMITVPVICVASYALLGGWNSVFAFAATSAIVLAQSVAMPVTADYLNHRIPNAQRATILSMRQLLTSVAIVALQPGLGLIADEVSLQAVFWTTAAFIGALAPFALFLWLRADSNEGRQEVVPAPAAEAAGS